MEVTISIELVKNKKENKFIIIKNKKLINFLIFENGL